MGIVEYNVSIEKTMGNALQYPQFLINTIEECLVFFAYYFLSKVCVEFWDIRIMTLTGQGCYQESENLVYKIAVCHL